MGDYVNVNGVFSRMGYSVVQQLSAPRADQEVYDYVDEAIDRAEKTINSFAHIRWQIPLPRSANADEWTYRIVEYELMKNGPGGQVPEKYKDGYDMTMKILFSMGKSEYEPIGAVPLESSTTIGHSIDVYGDTPMFTQYQTDQW